MVSEKAKEIIREGVEDGISSKGIIARLTVENESFRKTEMLLDIRRERATIFAQSETAKDNATTWFEEVYEVMRKENNWDSQQATRFWQKILDESYDNLEEAKKGSEYWELYRMASFE
jgi:hypothetical protein